MKPEQVFLLGWSGDDLLFRMNKSSLATYSLFQPSTNTQALSPEDPPAHGRSNPPNFIPHESVSSVIQTDPLDSLETVLMKMEEEQGNKEWVSETLEQSYREEHQVK